MITKIRLIGQIYSDGGGFHYDRLIPNDVGFDDTISNNETPLGESMNSFIKGVIFYSIKEHSLKNLLLDKINKDDNFLLFYTESGKPIDRLTPIKYCKNEPLIIVLMNSSGFPVEIANKLILSSYIENLSSGLNIDKSKLLHFIENADVENALKECFILYKNDHKKIVVITLNQARFNTLKNDYSIGLVPLESFTRSKIEILNILLDISANK